MYKQILQVICLISKDTHCTSQEMIGMHDSYSGIAYKHSLFRKNQTCIGIMSNSIFANQRISTSCNLSKSHQNILHMINGILYIDFTLLLKHYENPLCSKKPLKHKQESIVNYLLNLSAQVRQLSAEGPVQLLHVGSHSMQFKGTRGSKKPSIHKHDDSTKFLFISLKHVVH
jgi:hypothetical protein